MGIHNQFGKRNAPTILNAKFNMLQFWDGREPTLEEQSKGPMLNPIEMGMRPTTRWRQVKATRVSEAVQGSVRARRNYDDMSKRSRRTSAPRSPSIRPSTSSWPATRARSATAEARMGDLQRQGPLHVVSRMESDAADVQRQSLPQHRRVGAQQGFRAARAQGARRAQHERRRLRERSTSSRFEPT